jgi:uncharacterized cysteine cluster protein YcgN (CxxCxxCC family)
MDGDLTPVQPPFWRRKRLDQLTHAEWEALCDGCGLCCLIKLQDEDAPEGHGLHFTRVACRLLDTESCRCGAYDRRVRLVPDCVSLTPANLAATAPWMPRSCAYRLLHEGRDLPDWHPLITGDPDSPHAAGVSARGWTTPEYEVHEEDYEDHIIPGFA